ncbi:fibronectin type III domain-containing protein [Cochleicola gelatinilyticus]|uniref:Fibronectin type-III domain-containing protein n=1 Tax=Cochleicola gelatinilyticus TaxID=1763537 RepID=A0A167GAB4_9FLAO|nr:fibronectin type III domain-containing protein [Cochleicola gelatinilyticus]OAB77380.1 hypothetical protein ULVI_12840 [Cochleicola gelatinilyticus]
MKQLITLFFAICVSSFGTFAQCDISEFFDTYENNEVPVDWTMVNNTDGTSAYGRVTSNPAAPSPGKYFRMYSGNATTGDLIFISPMEATTADGNHRVKFYSQGTTDSSLIVGTTSAGDGSGTFTPIETIVLLGVSNDDWELQEIIIPAGTDQYLFFQHNLGSTFDQVNIDSVCLETIPTCLEVDNVTVTNPTQTTIDLSWEESGTGEDNWEYVVQEAETGIPTGNGTPYTSTNTNPSVTVTDLDSNTQYEAYIRSDCGEGDYGAWILSETTIRTSCAPLTANFCEDWAGLPENEVPLCWTAVDDPNTSGHVYIDYEFSGYNKNMLELYAVSLTQGDLIAISPEVSAFATDGAHRLKFTAGSSTDAPDILEVGTIDGDGNFVEITSLTLTTNRDTEYVVTLPDNGHENFAFKHSGQINKFLWINTVCVEDLPSCLEVVEVTASNVDFDSADISWTASESAETSWEYIVQEAALPAPDAATSGIETDVTSVNVDLAQNTAYIAYVRAKCTADDFGAWIASNEFTSSCASFIAEYQFGFEGPNVSGEDVKPCWSIYDTSVGDFKTYGNSFDIDPYDGDLMVRMFFASTADPEGLALITPEFSDLSTDKQIRFRMNNRANNEADFNIIVGTVADPSDLSTFEVLDDTSLNQSTIVAATWTEFTIDLSGYDTTLNHRYIAFKPQHSGTGPWQYVFLDDFNYEYAVPSGLNDEPETAAILTASDDYTCANAITGNYEGATQSEEYVCTAPDYSDYNDLWYRFTPETSGLYAFRLDAPNADEMNMFVFEGSTVELTPISSGCSTRYTARELNAGETYFVAIASNEPLAEFSLCVSKFPEVPANDEITNALVLLESDDDTCNNAVSGYTASATYSDDSNCTDSNVDVWYTFVPEQTGEYTFRRRFLNGANPTRVSVYEGTPGNLTPLTEGCGELRVLADLVAGEQYYVAVSSAGSSIPIYFTLCGYKSPPAPENDSCDTPMELNVGTTFEENEMVATITSGTTDLDTTPFPSCGTLEFDIYGRDVWFSVVVPPSGNFTVETRFQDDSLLSDTVMEGFTGECGIDTLEDVLYDLPPNGMLHCSDQFVIGSNQFAGIRYTNLQPGETIKIRVWGWARQFGDFKISAYDTTPECNSPDDVTITDVTETTATVSWTEPTPEPIGGYEYIVQAVDTGYPGAASGITTGGTEVFLTDLTPETAYEVYVKSNCDTNGSAWAGPFTFTTDVELGISEFDTTVVTFYPNPVTDVLNFSSEKTIDRIEVYSLTGQKVFATTINATSGRINLSDLSSGLYLLQATGNGTTQTVKLVVQ